MKTYIYRPTRERVEYVGIANEGQAKPGDPGHGMRLYAFRVVESGDLIQADAGEILTREQDGSTHAFSENRDVNFVKTVTGKCPNCGTNLVMRVDS